MKRILRPLASIGTAMAACAAVAGAALAQDAPEVGRPAPAFQAKDAAGRTVSLAGFHGKPVVLEWTNDGCPFVQHAYKSGVMQQLQKRAAAQGVVWLSVISSAPGKQGYLKGPEVQGWERSTGAEPADVLLDPAGALGRRYGAKATPTVFLVGADGGLLYMGGFDDRPSTDPADAKSAKNYVALALDDLKSGHPIADAVTRPYGCSVKY